MLVRIRSSEGTTRLEVKPDDTILMLKERVAKELDVQPASCVISRDMKGDQRLSDSLTIQKLNIGNGDILHLNIARDQHPHLMTGVIAKDTNAPFSPPEDDVDIVLDQQDGLIPRVRDPRVCRHGPNGMCEQCSPIEPYDATYLASRNIKHTSFHAYLKQLRTNQRHESVALSTPSYRLRPGCTDHFPWPRGLCTKCQPPAVTLKHQPFRMVDHVEFENADIVDTFLQPWRATGSQRFGYLYGKYDVYTEVPLGMKAVVSAIYEPAQAWHQEGIELHEEDNQLVENVQAVRDLLHLQCVGMIYTDLTDDGTGSGTVEYKRHMDTYFLSCTEVIFSAHMQAKHPSPCHYSETGYFGSKFVTVVVTGDQEGHITLSSYQASNQAMAMYEADILEASVDPAVMRVSSDEGKYIPDVFFSIKNEYNVQITRPAKPTFPVEYLLVTLTHGFPKEPRPLFTREKPFPIEHRELMPQQIQTVSALKQHLNAQTIERALSDFHLLLFLSHSGLYEMAVDFPALCHAVYENYDHNKMLEMLDKSISWQTLQQVLLAAPASHQWACESCSFNNKETDDRCAMCNTTKGNRHEAMTDGNETSAMTDWSCPACTFINHGGSVCEICGAGKIVELE